MTGKSDYTLKLLPGDGVLRAEAVFPREFVGFDGHFPGDPLLPGFVQIQLALEVLREAGRRCELKEVLVAKFMRPVLPGVWVMVVLTQGDGDSYEVVVAREGEMCSMFTLVVGEGGS